MGCFRRRQRGRACVLHDCSAAVRAVWTRRRPDSSHLSLQNASRPRVYLGRAECGRVTDMPFCSSCGADVAGVKFCSKCGQPVEDASTSAYEAPGAAAAAAPPPAAAAPIANDNVLGAVAYVSVITACIGLALRPDRLLRRRHAQSSERATHASDHSRARYLRATQPGLSGPRRRYRQGNGGRLAGNQPVSRAFR